VRWQETPQGRESRLNGVLIDRYAPGENAGYPTLCKGRFDVGTDENYYAIEEPTSLNTLELLPQLQKMGVKAPSRSKAASAARPTWPRSPRCGARRSTTAWPIRTATPPSLSGWPALDQVAEGQQHTLGATTAPGSKLLAGQTAVTRSEQALSSTI
jgi:hypothetical protein